MENNKINIAEILKNCPSGMKLNSPLVDELYFDCITPLNTIKCYTREHNESNQICNSIYFNYDGSYLNHPNSKCVIFPLDKTTWKGFVLHNEFKDGDIVATDTGDWIGITTGGETHTYIPTYCVLQSDNTFETYFNKKEKWAFNRLATEEEKNKLFSVIKTHGYRWNEEIKSLEKLVKPKFKVGDVIQDKDGYKVEITEVNIGDECYVYLSKLLNWKGSISFYSQDKWELVPDKFDIYTLKPFDKVLVRNYYHEKWNIEFFARRNDEKRFETIIGISYNQCIPFEGNEHLLNKIDDCNNYYKIW